MPKQSIIAQIESVRVRAGRSSTASTLVQFEALNRLWAGKREHLEVVRDFFPMRIVTLLDVFLRQWIEILVDHGSPYAERGEKLWRQSAKLDYSILLATRNKNVSIGQLDQWVKFNSRGPPLQRIPGVYERIVRTGAAVYSVALGSACQIARGVVRDGSSAAPLHSSTPGGRCGHFRGAASARIRRQQRTG